MYTIEDNRKGCDNYFDKSDHMYLSMDVLQLYVASSSLQNAIMHAYGNIN